MAYQLATCWNQRLPRKWSRKPRPVTKPGVCMWGVEELTEATRDQFVRGLIPMAYQLARKYATQGWDHDELLSAALLGLANAVSKFDPQRGVKPSTYGHIAMERAIWREIQLLRTNGMTGCSGKHPTYPVPCVESYDAYESFDAPDYDEPIDEDLTSDVLEAHKLLNSIEDERARGMVEDRYFAGLTLGEIGVKWKLSTERTRQIIARELKRIRVKHGRGA